MQRQLNFKKDILSTNDTGRIKITRCQKKKKEWTSAYISSIEIYVCIKEIGLNLL